MSRVYNFSAGPSMLPEEVLKKAASEMLDYEGSGQSVMEMSHRSKVYDNIIKTAGTYRNLSFIIAFPSLVCKTSSHKAKKFFPIIKLVF